MAKGVLQRQKIKSKNTASVTPISPSGRFEVYLGEGVGIDCVDLINLTNGDGVIRSLNLYLRGFRIKTARNIANEILAYLRFSLSISAGVINTYSLKEYVNKLSCNSKITLNTKYQKYRIVSSFIEYLIEKEIVFNVEIPVGFDSSQIPDQKKQSFSEIAREFVEDESNFDAEVVLELMSLLDIPKHETQSLVFSVECMEVLHEQALLKIAEWEGDWVFVESIIRNLSQEDVEYIEGLDGISDSSLNVERTVEDALGVLYAKFGSNIPAVRFWPNGLETFLRTKNWRNVAIRVKSIFNESSTDEDAHLLFNLKKLSEDRLEQYRTLETFYINEKMFDKRSVELAISILYVNYGRMLPSSEEWPDGVADYLKNRGWAASRVKSALFPTTDVVTPFIVGLLSYKPLSPNVDTISQYAYLNSFLPGSIEGVVKVFFDKFRGTSPLEAEVNMNDGIVSACIRHVARMETVLEGLGDVGREILRKDKVPLWLQYTQQRNGNLAEDVKCPDPSTVTRRVRGFINECSDNSAFLSQIQTASGENFRPTFALIMRLSGESIKDIQKTLNHEFVSTTYGYTERLHSQSILKTKAKKFMRYLVDSAFEGSAEFRSEGAEDSEDLFDATKDGVDEWLNCQAQRFWFNDVEIIAQWVAWERAISEVQEDLIFENPERWEKYWAPRLVRYKNLLALVSVVELKKAGEVAKGVVLPPLL